MDAVSITISTNPNKKTPGIKMIRVGYHVEGIHLNGRIGYKVELNVEFFYIYLNMLRKWLQTMPPCSSTQ